jgi:phage tail-like protein
MTMTQGVDGLEEDLLGRYLPGILRQDPLLAEFLRAFDAQLRPVLDVLDAMDCYLDPDLAPSELVSWLGTWLGVAAPQSSPDAARRSMIKQAAALHRARGTKEGLKRALELVCGREVLVVENTEGLRLDGDARLCINTALLGTSPNNIYIVVQGSRGEVDAEAISQAAESMAPAHARVTIRFADE